jgi:glycosyltransferase involved in cell wall biosynthesis
MSISVVIPTKNRKEYLLRAVKSVLPQLSSEDEIIIVDDGSDCTNYEGLDDSKISIIKNKKSFGGAEARNIGAKSARNEILMFLDDDDAWEPNKVISQIYYLENPDNVIVFSGKKVVWDTDLNSPFREIKVLKRQYSITELLECNYVGSTSSVALKKQDFLDVNGFDTELECFQDYDLWIRLLKSKNGFAFFDGCTNVIYTVFKKEGMQISRSTDGRHIKASDYLLSKYNDKFSHYELLTFKVNLYQLVSKAMNHSNPKVSFTYAFTALRLKPSLRGVKFTLASILSYFGYKHG